MKENFSMNQGGQTEVSKKETNEALQPYEGLLANKQIRSIVAELVRGSAKFRDALSLSDVDAFLMKYPTPESLKKDSQEFLNKIESLNSPQKRAEYEASLSELIDSLYPSESNGNAIDLIELIKKEEDEDRIRILIRGQLEYLLNNFKKKGFKIDKDFLLNDQFQDARNSNPIITASEERIRELHKDEFGYHGVPAFIDIEESLVGSK